MDVNMLLYISLLIYIIVMGFAFIFKIKWLYMVAGLTWFIPIIEIDNLFLTLISVIMLLTHGIMGFYSPQETEW